MDIFHNPSKYFDLSKTQVKISPLQESPSEKEIINYVQKTLEHIIYNEVYALFQDIGLNLEGIIKQQDKNKKYPELLIEKRIGVCRNAARYAISILEKNGIWAKTLTIQEKYDFTRHDCVLFKSKKNSKFYIWDVTYYMIGQSGPNGAYHQLLRAFQKGNSDFCDYLEKTIKIPHDISQKIAKYYHNKEVDASSDEYKYMFKFLNNNGYEDIFEFINCKEKLLQKVCENPIIDFKELPKLYHTGTYFWLDRYENPEPLDLISLQKKISSIK